MDDLVTFLRTQLDADELAAKATAEFVGDNFNADPDRWAWGGGGGPGVPFDLLSGLDVGEWMEPLGRYIARHDPARVLREVAAHRAIVNDCEKRRSVQGKWTLRDLAAVYADRDGYRPEWAPGS